MEPQPQKEDLVKYHEPGNPQARVLRGRVDDTDPKFVVVKRHTGDVRILWDRVISIRRGSRPDGATT